MITYQSHSNNKNNADFALSLLKGRIGQSIIETYLVASGYEIYPYGYENNYVNITRFVKKDQSDTTTSKIRSMPDLLVCDRTNNERFLLQIKATNTRDESSYWIKKDNLDNYIKYWAEALLVVYFIRTGKIYCLKIADIKNPTEGLRPNSSESGFLLDLNDFHNFTEYFSHISSSQYADMRRKIASVLTDFSPIVMRFNSKKTNDDSQIRMSLELSP
jgi:hypothetical protein